MLTQQILAGICIGTPTRCGSLMEQHCAGLLSSPKYGVNTTLILSGSCPGRREPTQVNKQEWNRTDCMEIEQTDTAEGDGAAF